VLGVYYYYSVKFDINAASCLSKTYNLIVVRYFWLCCIEQQMLYVLWNSLNTCSPESFVILLTAVDCNWIKSWAYDSKN